MTTAREIMTSGAECIGENETSSTPHQDTDLGIGSMPICGEDDRLKGMVTDRDIVVRCVAAGRIPRVRAGSVAGGKPVTIGADDAVEEALRTMAQHKVRRLPVIDGHRLVGMVSQGDIAGSCPRNASTARRGDLLRPLTAAPIPKVDPSERKGRAARPVRGSRRRRRLDRDRQGQRRRHRHRHGQRRPTHAARTRRGQPARRRPHRIRCRLAGEHADPVHPGRAAATRSWKRRSRSPSRPRTS